MQSLLDSIRFSKIPRPAPDSGKLVGASRGARVSPGRLLFVCAALSSGLGLSACNDDEDPWGSNISYVDAGGSGGTLGGPGGAVGTPDGGSGAPFDGGITLPASDAATGTIDSGASSGGLGADSGNGGPIGGASDGGGLMGGASDAGAQGGDGGGDAATTPPRADLGKGDGSDVLMIGDSWMSLGSTTSGIQGGVLKASGQPYRAYAIGGTTLLGGGLLGALLTPIPAQYQEAVQADADVKTVIMTGGGNDILQTGLQGDCQMEGAECAEQVTKILDALSTLWSEMAGDGVQDLVYILYATPEGTSVDFALPDGDGARQRCANVPAPMRCHIVETLATVMGDIPDGIHPSQAASDRIGQAVFELMTARGMRR